MVPFVEGSPSLNGTSRHLLSRFERAPEVGTRSSPPGFFFFGCEQWRASFREYTHTKRWAGAGGEKRRGERGEAYFRDPGGIYEALVHSSPLSLRIPRQQPAPDGDKEKRTTNASGGIGLWLGMFTQFLPVTFFASKHVKHTHPPKNKNAFQF